MLCLLPASPHPPLARSPFPKGEGFVIPETTPSSPPPFEKVCAGRAEYAYSGRPSDSTVTDGTCMRMFSTMRADASNSTASVPSPVS